MYLSSTNYLGLLEEIEPLVKESTLLSVYFTRSIQSFQPLYIIMRYAAPFVLVVAVLNALQLLVEAYPSGPPLSACISMVPTAHGASTLTGTTPFSITTNTTFYNAGENIEGKIINNNFHLFNHFLWFLFIHY